MTTMIDRLCYDRHSFYFTMSDIPNPVLTRNERGISLSFHPIQPT